MSLTPPTSPFPTAFTKALSLAISYKGRINLASFQQAGEDWDELESAQGDTTATALDFIIGTIDNNNRGLLVITPDSWLKAWPGSKAVVLGKSDPYPQGDLNYPGGYDPSKYAVPVHRCKIAKRRGGKLDVNLTAAFYSGKRLTDCGSTMRYTLDSKMPLLIFALWLEADQHGRIVFPKWPGGGSKTVAL